MSTPWTCPTHLFTAIDHVGIAVPDLDEAIAFYRDDLRHAGSSTRRPTRSRACARRWSPSATPAPASSCSRRSTDESTIAKFLDRTGPGIQQLAYRVADVDAVSRDPARARRAPAVRRPAARHRRTRRINFVHPKDAGGVLRRAGRAGRRPRTETGDVRTPDVTRALPTGNSRPHRPAARPDQEHRRAADPRRHPGRRHHRGGLRRPRAARVLPRRDRPQGRGRHVRGPRQPRTRTRASRCTSRTSPLPELGPGEALVAVMASAINYNTVWTSIFEPVSTFGFLERYGRTRPLTKRHDLPYHVVGSDLSGVVLQTGPGVHHVEARRRGRRALPVGRAREPRRPQRHDARPRAADLGLRDQLRRPRRHRAGQVQPADAQARAPDLGGGRLARAWSTPRRTASWSASNGAGMKQGDNVLIWGASRRPRRLRDAVRPQRRRRPRSAWSPTRRRPTICRSDGRRADHQPLRGGLPVLEGRAHPGPEGVAALRQRRSASSPAARTSTSSSSTRAARPSAPRVYVARKGGTIVTCASTSGYMHEYDNRYLWMNLKRIIGSHFANYRESWEANRLIAKGMIHPTLSQDLPPRRGRPGRARRPPQRPPGQGRRALPGPRGGPRRARRGAARPAPRRDQPLPRRLSPPPSQHRDAPRRRVDIRFGASHGVRSDRPGHRRALGDVRTATDRTTAERGSHA